MKKCLLLSLFLLTTISWAQDVLFLKNDTKLDVKIIDADSAQVKYTLTSNPNGPAQTEVAKHIKLILFEDGSIKHYYTPADHIHTPEELEKSAKHAEVAHYYNAQYYLDVSDSELTRSKNVLFFNAAEFLNASLAVSYWRELFKNRLIVQVSAGTGFSTPFLYNILIQDYSDVKDFHPTKKAFDVGGGLYFNTVGHGKFAHFIGPYVRTAQYNGTFETTYFTYIPDALGQSIPIANYEKHAFIFNESYAYLNNGLLIRITQNFDMMLNIAVGMKTPRKFISNDPADYYPTAEPRKSIDAKQPAFQFGFNFGYRF